jgi:predicted transcriptional regulator
MFDEGAPETPVDTRKLTEQVVSALPITRALTTARQMTDERRGNLEKAINFLTGLKTHVVNERSRDTLLEQKARESLQEAGGRVFSRAYVPEKQLAAASEDERRRLLAINELLQRLAERAKAMSENRPVPQLFDRP